MNLIILKFGPIAVLSVTIAMLPLGAVTMLPPRSIRMLSFSTFVVLSFRSIIYWSFGPFTVLPSNVRVVLTSLYDFLLSRLLYWCYLIRFWSLLLFGDAIFLPLLRVIYFLFGLPQRSLVAIVWLGICFTLLSILIPLLIIFVPLFKSPLITNVHCSNSFGINWLSDLLYMSEIDLHALSVKVLLDLHTISHTTWPYSL